MGAAVLIAGLLAALTVPAWVAWGNWPRHRVIASLATLTATVAWLWLLLWLATR